MKQFFAIADSINENGQLEFIKVTESVGGWPLFLGDSWNESNFDWLETMYKLSKKGYSSDQFINFKIQTDLMNNTRNLIHV